LATDPTNFGTLAMTASVRTLNICAAIVWYSGGVALTIKGFSLIMAAGVMNTGGMGWRLAALLGIGLGALKAAYLFNRACKSNLSRIAALSNPKIWNFYRAWFFIFLFCMIYLGGHLSRSAEGNYPFLLAVAILDISIGIALLGSSYVFWVRKAFSR
jgi:hypothetical protein